MAPPSETTLQMKLSANRIQAAALFRPALNALALYWPAFIGLQLAAGASVVAYYNVEEFRAAADALLRFRERAGLPFVMAATVISGAVVPELCKVFLRPSNRPKPGIVDWVHLMALMALLGVLVDSFYRVQAALFGTGFEWWRLAFKIIVDQGIYTPFLALPIVIAWFSWKENQFHLGRSLQAWTPRFFVRRILPIYLPNLAFWVPSLIAVYALPTPLQFILFLFLNGAWCLVMIFIAREGDVLAT